MKVSKACVRSIVRYSPSSCTCTGQAQTTQSPSYTPYVPRVILLRDPEPKSTFAAQSRIQVELVALADPRLWRRTRVRYRLRGLGSLGLPDLGLGGVIGSLRTNQVVVSGDVASHYGANWPGLALTSTFGNGGAPGGQRRWDRHSSFKLWDVTCQRPIWETAASHEHVFRIEMVVSASLNSPRVSPGRDFPTAVAPRRVPASSLAGRPYNRFRGSAYAFVYACLTPAAIRY
jgi:hypothetical protein